MNFNTVLSISKQREHNIPSWVPQVLAITDEINTFAALR